jgi:two-component system alkaline phosphatase synthesis response regulator PhoP
MSVSRAELRTPRILVVEDDPAVRMSLRLAGQKEGLEVAEAVNGPEALAQLAGQRPDLVLLDLMLPGQSGFEVCRSIHQYDPSLPIIILTARGDEVDKIVGLELGADDYVTKPFSPRELIARIRAVLRRSARAAEVTPAAAPAQELTLNGLRIDVPARQVALDGRLISLTRTEFDLLATLAGHLGQVLSRDQLVAQVWGYQAEGDTRLLDSHIAHLRAKIERDPSRPRYLQTVRDVGYRLDAPGVARRASDESEL